MDDRLPELLARWREGVLSPAEQTDLLARVRGSEEARRLAAEDRLMDRLLCELHRPSLDADRVLRALADRPGSLATRTLAAVEARKSSGRRLLAIPAFCLEVLRHRFALPDGVRRRAAPWPRLASLGAAAVAVLAAAWFLLGPALARTIVIGELAAVVGQPTLHRGDGQSLLVPRPSTPIHLGDRLETGDADRAEIRFRDGTTLRLAFNTTVEVGSQKSEVRSQKSASSLVRPSEIRLLKGHVWTQVQKTTNATPYAIRTDVATAIARGTEFGVRLQRVPDGPDPSSGIRHPESDRPLLAVLTVKEGAVDFSNAFGTVQATAMTESTARADSAPTEPRRIETLQTVQLDSGATWSLLTAPLDWPEAATKLVGGGGSVGWQLLDMPGTNGRPEVRIARLPSVPPAARAGLRLGDVVAAVDGQAVTNARQIASTILFRPGAAVNLRVRRATGEETVAVPVSAEANALRGPNLPAAATDQIADLLHAWLAAPANPAPNAATEARRFEQAASLSRSNLIRTAAFNQLGVAFELDDALGPAVRAYGRAAYLDPDVPLYRFNLGLALRKIGSLERALEEFEAAARLEPESVPARLRVAEVTSLLGRHAEALVLAEALVQAAPQDHSVWELKTQLLLKLQRPADAIPPGRLAAELDPDCPVAHAYLAEALHAAGRLDEALAAWTEALDRAPFEAAFILNRGTVQRDLGQSAAGEQSFRQALQLRPGFALAHFNLGNALADRGEYAAAAAAFGRAREIDPADAAAHWRFGDMALKQRQFGAAERAYRDALDVAPGSAEAWYGLGETHRVQRRSADAERAYRRAIELRPDYAAPHTALGIVFYDRGGVDEAERLYRRAIELDPAQAAPYHNLGTLNRESRGDLDAAERWFRQALERAPDDGESLGGLGLVASSRGDLAEAERLLRQALERAPASSALHNNLGEVLRERGRLDEAEPLYRKALELDPDNPAPYGNLGIICAERKQFAEAEKTFRALLDRSAGNARLPALVNLAMVCSEQVKLDEAERLFRQALELTPNHPRVSASFASFLADHQLQLDEALALADRAVRAQPDNPECLDSLGWVQAQRGDLDAAERTLQRALKFAGEEPPAEEIRRHLGIVRERRASPTR